MSNIPSTVDFKDPRQKMWGILKDKTLAKLNYGNVSDSVGVAITSYGTNCYRDCLDQARILIAAGTGTANVQIVEFVPYDYTMTPTV